MFITKSNYFHGTYLYFYDGLIRVKVSCRHFMFLESHVDNNYGNVIQLGTYNIIEFNELITSRRYHGLTSNFDFMSVLIIL